MSGNKFDIVQITNSGSSEIIAALFEKNSYESQY